MTQLLRYLVKSFVFSVRTGPWFCWQDLVLWAEVATSQILRHTQSRRIVIKRITCLTNCLFFVVILVTLMQSCVRVTLMLRVELGLVLAGHEVNLSILTVFKFPFFVGQLNETTWRVQIWQFVVFLGYHHNYSPPSPTSTRILRRRIDDSLTPTSAVQKGPALQGTESQHLWHRGADVVHVRKQ